MSKNKKTNMKYAGGKFTIGDYIIGYCKDFECDDYGDIVVYPDVKEIYIERVMYNNPATIVFWNDGSKTVSKCAPGDNYSTEIGLAMCILKKLAGTNNLTNTFKNWVSPDPHSEVTLTEVRKRFR